VQVLGTTFKSGGCINNALKIKTSDGDYFVKWQKGIPEDMFEKESTGLDLLRKTRLLKIPEVIGLGKLDGKHYLVMEHIESIPPKTNYWSDFGASLAQMHLNNSAERYGLDHHNYIGKLPQFNTGHSDWIEFFIEQRLDYQLKLAVKGGMVDSSFVNRYRSFYMKLPELLPVDQPALLHGDMWSGNVMVSSDGLACLIDPAVYYGHREIELAFTQMFGGFGPEFYTSYQEAYPLDPGFDERVSIYNIYPHMVHVNLFGTSYLGGVESVLRRYL